MMKNDAMFNMIKGSCIVTAPEILSKLSFDAASEYKDTVAAPSPKKSYIKAAVVYAAACLVIAVVIPFIIMNVRNMQPSVPSAPVTGSNGDEINTDEKSIRVEDINEIYNGVDPATYTQKVTVEEVEKIIEAVCLAYNEYDTIVLLNGNKFGTTPKKPNITKSDLENMFEGDERLIEYKTYFQKMNRIVYDAISARFNKNSTRVIEPIDYTSPPYASFWVLDLEATAFTDSEIIEHLMFENGNGDIRYFCDIIAYGFGNEAKDYFAYYTETLGKETMLFPSKEEYEILNAKLPPVDNIKAVDINEFYNGVDPATLSERVTKEEAEKIIAAVRLAYDDYNTIILSDGTKVKTTPKKPDITEDDLESMRLYDGKYKDYKAYFDNMYRIIYDALNSRFSEKTTYIPDVKTESADPLTYWILYYENTRFENLNELENFFNGNGDRPYPCDLICFSPSAVSRVLYCSSSTSVGRSEILLFPTDEEYKLLEADIPDHYSGYSLAIEDEILASDSHRTREELISHGYEEVTPSGDKFLMREFECETGAVDFRVYTDLESDEEPFVEAFDYPYTGYIKGKMRVLVGIRVADLLIKIRVTVDEGDPVILPETVEAELRYILNIEKPADNSKVLLNIDLVSDYGKTFDELQEKYGKVIDYYTPRGGNAFRFERGYGFYECGEYRGEWVDDKSVVALNGNGEKLYGYPLVEGNTTCYTIDKITADDLFAGKSNEISIDDISRIPGMTYIKTVRGMSAPKEYNYISYFKYEGFYHQNTTVYVYHVNRDVVLLSEEVKIDTPRPYSDAIQSDPSYVPPVTDDNACTCEGGHHHEFNNETMTLMCYEGNTVEMMIYLEYTFSGEILRIFKDGIEVFEGPVEDGMIIKKYHNDVYCREYTITMNK